MEVCVWDVCIYLGMHIFHDVYFGMSLHISVCAQVCMFWGFSACIWVYAFFGLWHVSRCVFLERLGVSGCVHVYMFISGYFCMYLGMHMYMCWCVSSCVQVSGTPQGLCACAIPAHIWRREAQHLAAWCLVSRALGLRAGLEWPRLGQAFPASNAAEQKQAGIHPQWRPCPEQVQPEPAHCCLGVG